MPASCRHTTRGASRGRCVLNANAPSFEFSRIFDRVDAARTFQSRGRVRIPEVLTAPSAAALHECLLRDVPWKLVYNRGSQPIVLEPAQVKGMNATQAQQMHREIVQGARAGFQYSYYSYPMVTAYLNRENPELLLHRLLEWLATPLVLDVIRAVTGIPELVKCDAQATCYLASHFLTRHDDRGEGTEGRRVGYVLNLARRWQPDWGGLLQFLRPPDGQEVEESWSPQFNSLVLFRVPVLHSVSFVTPFAGAPRFAVTGWFRDA